ncbi:inverse autotransporter beta domain-containing protein, partial [Pectobacterium parvum]
MKRNPFHSGAAFLRRIAWLNIIVQLMFPLLSAFTPATARVNISQTDINKTEKKTIFTETYTLKKGETASSVAKKYNLTLDELHQLNQQRFFPHTFSHIQAGEEIDVPHKKSPFSVDNTNNKNTDANTEKKLAGQVYAGATVLSNENAAKSGERMLRSTATNQINHSVEQWLSQFGTARVKINSNNKLDGSAADILIPLYDQKDAMLFTQLGARNKDSRNTVNVGIGFRTFNNNWMYGVNSFLDNDITGKNRRISLGAEAWTDYLKLSANSYFGITDWHQSRDFNGYNERPADGYDIRAEAYLPSYPQIGGKLMYEKYRGENVALFGKENQQKNPYAATIGVNYTPFPLLTVGTEHRTGKGGQEDNNISLQLNYSFGNSWQYHISPSALATHRVVSGNRYNLVERNNHIVLDYQKKDEIQLTLPESIQGNTGDTATVTASVTGKHALERIEWSAAPLVAAGGKLTPTSINTVAITLPPYQHSGGNNTNHYQLTAFAYDVEGNQSNQAVTEIKVDEQEISAARSTTTATPNILPADGQATSLIAITLRDNNNNPVSGVASQLVLSTIFTANTMQQRQIEANKDIHIGTITESSAGVYHSTLTAGSQIGIVTIQPSINEQKLQTANVSLIANENSAAVTSLTPDVATAQADNMTPVTFTATVKDSSGHLAPNTDISFTTTDGTLSQTTAITNASGEATVSLTSATIGDITVTAKVNNNAADTGKSATVAFINANVVSLTPDVTTAIADNFTPITFTATVRDTLGNLVPNADVGFTNSSGTLSQPIAITNANGEATVSLTSATIGDITVTAKV